MENKKSNCGRKAGIRGESYNQAMQDYFMGKGSISELAKKYKINRSGLSTAINSTKEINCINVGDVPLKEFATSTKETILAGINNLETLKNSTEVMHRNIAENIMEEIKATNLKTAKYIQLIGSKLLQDFEKELEFLRENGALNLDRISDSFEALDKANKVLGLPKAPLIAVQNNIQNNQLNSKGSLDSAKKHDFNININFIKAKKKKDDDIIDVESENIE
ncbi:hypothetical protein GJ234_07640 [Campylobacter jejuni]|nr:hypothetical protein [Campylobacter jejuni]